MSIYYTDERVTLHLGKALDVLPEIPDASVDAVVCDPPYALTNLHPNVVIDALTRWLAGDRAYIPSSGRGGFMGASWDEFVPPPAAWDECLRVLKPGGHLLAFAAPRTQDLMGLSIRIAGFEIRDGIDWIFGCLDDQTEIMIDGRWTQWRNASKGSYALGYDTERDEFSWQPIQRVVVFPYSDTAYRLVGNHTDQFVTREHRCLVERGGSYTFQEAQEAARERQARVPVLEDVQAVLNALPLPHQGAGSAQPHLFEGMRESNDWRGEYRTAESASKSPALVPGVRKGLPSLSNQAAWGSRSGVFATVPGGAGLRPPADASCRGAQRVDQRIAGIGPSQIAWFAEPGVEGRSDLLPEKGQLQGRQVRAVPDGVCADGPEGRLRNGTSAGSGARDGQTTDEDGGRASRGSRSDEQHPREPLAVQVQPRAQAVRGSRFTTADLVRIEPEHYNGIAWCITVPTGAFVARRNGKVFVTGNSGFPKGQDIAKSIDRRRDDRSEVLQVTAWLAAARDEAGWTNKRIDALFGTNGMSGLWTTQGVAAIVPKLEQWKRIQEAIGFDDVEILPLVQHLNTRKGEIGEAWAQREVVGHRHAGLDNGGSSVFLSGTTGRDENGMVPVTAAATDAAEQWQGWNTSLKPAHEPIIVARKSTGFNTVVANVLEHGTGAINVNACRTEAGEDYREKCASVVGLASNRNGATLGEWTGVREDSAHQAGRWPTNLLLAHSPDCADLCAESCPIAEMNRQSGITISSGGARGGRIGANGILSGGFKHNGPRVNAGGLGDSGGASRFFPAFRYEPKAPASERPRLDDGTVHTTVKPLDLMRWLVRLVTPPGGTVLDPFVGSGTTLEACLVEGFHGIGIEQHRPYADLCVKRLSKPIQAVLGFDEEAAS